MLPTFSKGKGFPANLVFPAMERTILITSAISKFGQEMTQVLANQGHQVYAGIPDIHHVNAPLAKKLLSTPRVSVVELDPTNNKSIERAVRLILNNTEYIDIVIHNSGTFAMGITEDFTPERVEEIFDSNVMGVHRINRAVLPHMRKRHKGQLIYISSTLARLPLPFMGIFNASKFALEGLAESYNYELNLLGINSTVIEPGLCPENFYDNFIESAHQDRAAHYGKVLRDYHLLMTELRKKVDGLTITPTINIANAINNLINLPSDQRPFRLVVDFDNQLAIEEINDLTSRFENDFLKHLGHGRLYRKAG